MKKVNFFFYYYYLKKIDKIFLSQIRRLIVFSALVITPEPVPIIRQQRKTSSRSTDHSASASSSLNNASKSNSPSKKRARTLASSGGAKRPKSTSQQAKRISPNSRPAKRAAKEALRGTHACRFENCNEQFAGHRSLAVHIDRRHQSATAPPYSQSLINIEELCETYGVSFDPRVMNLWKT